MVNMGFFVETTVLRGRSIEAVMKELEEWLEEGVNDINSWRLVSHTVQQSGTIDSRQWMVTAVKERKLTPHDGATTLGVN